MQSSPSYRPHRPRLHLALAPQKTAVIGLLLDEMEWGFGTLEKDGLLDSAKARPIAAAGPLMIEINALLMRGHQPDLHRTLTELSIRNPIIAVLDEALLDVIGPLLDVPGLEFLVWPEKKEPMMAVLQSVDRTDRLSERAKRDEKLDVESLRGEVERIAHALAELVSNPATSAGEEAAAQRSARESARLIREIIHNRRARMSFFPAELFADPAWDILLDLAAARHEGVPVSISSLCIAANVPTTTGLRWIKALTDAGLLVRQADPHDGRRSFITLTEETAEQMERYLNVIS